MTDYAYRIYKRAGMWLVRKRRQANASTVQGPFLGIGNAWDWIKEDIRRREVAIARARRALAEAHKERGWQPR